MASQRTTVPAPKRGPQEDEQLTMSCHRFLAADSPDRKDQAGRALVRAIFGKDAIAEDQARLPFSAE